MHEYSVVLSLIESCEYQLKEHNANIVTKVTLKIGVLSGVEPSLLETAFDTFKEGTVCDKAELVLNIQKIVIRCNDCISEHILEKFEFLCPKCQSSNINILDGQEMLLMQLEMQ